MGMDFPILVSTLVMGDMALRHRQHELFYILPWDWHIELLHRDLCICRLGIQHHSADNHEGKLNHSSWQDISVAPVNNIEYKKNQSNKLKIIIIPFI